MKPEIVLNIYDPAIAIIIVLSFILLILIAGMAIGFHDGYQAGIKGREEEGFLKPSNQKGR